jgi:hypothetical protein
VNEDKLTERYIAAKEAYRGDKSEANRRARDKARDELQAARAENRRDRAGTEVSVDSDTEG